jgi:hypothetical protein
MPDFRQAFRAQYVEDMSCRKHAIEQCEDRKRNMGEGKGPFPLWFKDQCHVRTNTWRDGQKTYDIDTWKLAWDPKTCPKSQEKRKLFLKCSWPSMEATAATEKYRRWSDDRRSSKALTCK